MRVGGQPFALDIDTLRSQLRRAPQVLAAKSPSSPLVIELPDPDGKSRTFSIIEQPVMSPALMQKYPSIKTYSGRGIEDPTAVLRADLSNSRFRAQVLSSDGDWFIDRSSAVDATLYRSYYKGDFDRKAYSCLAKGRGPLPKPSAPLSNGSPVVVREYRLAVAATAEYTAYISQQNENPPNVADAMTAISSTVNMVNAIVERDFAIVFRLVDNNDLVVFTDPLSDGFTEVDEESDLDEGPNSLHESNQAILDAAFQTTGYDVGHVFYHSPTVGGGSAASSSTCLAHEKAQGASGGSAPDVDTAWISLVAHELGHQFGAEHTFNSISGPCADQRAPSSAFEIGAGSTLMSYAGSCPGDSFQGQADAYAHAHSILEVTSFVRDGGGSACGGPVPGTANTAPSVSAAGGFVIPIRTAFELSASGSDAEGDYLTYAWEQFDLGPAGALTDPDNGVGPINRSWQPSSSPTRSVPMRNDHLYSTIRASDKVPLHNRPAYQWTVAVRDGRGGVSFAQIALVVTEQAGPFQITSQRVPTTWLVDTEQTVTWDVNGTTAGPVNCMSVDILLSLDGGHSFPVTLLTNAPNVGTATITVPPAVTTQGRVMVKAVGNIFFDINRPVAALNEQPFITIEGSLNAATVAGRSTGTLNSESVSDYDVAGFGLASAASDAEWIFGPQNSPLCSDGFGSGSGAAEASRGVLKGEASCEHQQPIYVSDPVYSSFCVDHHWDVTHAHGGTWASELFQISTDPWRIKEPVFYRVRTDGSTMAVPGGNSELNSWGYAYIATSHAFYQDGVQVHIVNQHASETLEPDGDIVHVPIGPAIFGKLPVTSAVPLTVKMALQTGARCHNAATSSDASNTSYFELWSFEPEVLVQAESGHSYAPEPCAPGPAIVQHPSGASSCPQSTTAFSMNATGGDPILYGWQFQAQNGDYVYLVDGSNRDPFTGRTLMVTGADGPTLNVLSVLGPSTPVNIRGRAFNVCGAAASNPAALTPLQATPSSVISHPLDASACPGVTVTFDATVVGTLPIVYEWEAELETGVFSELTDGELVHDGVVLGSVTGASTSSMQFTPSGSFSQQRSSLRMRCHASNVCNAAYTNPATLVVPQAPGSVSLALLKPAPAVAELSWAAAPNATAYDVIRGALGTLRESGGNFTIATDLCLVNDLSSTSVSDGATPPLGDGFWYLTRGVGCGAGSYDFVGAGQDESRDDEILTSGAACP